MTPTTLAPEIHVGRAQQPFVERFRFGLWVIIGSNGLFALADLLIGPPDQALLFGLKLAQVLAAGTALAGLRFEALAKRAVPIALVVTSVVSLTTAASGILTGDAITTSALCVLLTFATATVLPWGSWPQLVVAGVASLAILWNAYQIVGSLGAMMTYPAVAVVIGLVGSVYIAHGLSRLRQSEGQAVAALRASEATLRMVFAGMQDVFFRNDLQGVIRMISPSVQTLGYTPNDLIGRDARVFFCDEADQERARVDLLTHGSYQDREIRLKRRDGTTVIVSSSAHVVLDADGHPVAFEGMLRDITARTAAQEALRISEERFRALVQNASDAICVVDGNTIIRYASPAMERIVGFRSTNMVGTAAPQYVHPDDLAALYSGFAAVASGAPYRAEYRIRHVNGAWVHVEATGSVHLADPAIRGTVLNVRDISDRKRLDQQRSDFVAMLAHDIRNPLSVIGGYTEMLLESPELTVQSRGMLDACARSVLSLQSLVTNYLQHSQIEAGQLTLRRQQIAINPVLEHLEQPYRTMCNRRDISLTVQLQPGLPLIDADPVAIERVFANLLQNALKFTPDAGRITVRSERDDGAVIVSIADTGPGIAEDEVATLFDRYRQASDGRSRGGVGLGLFIVRALVAAHGGKVEVTSTLGVGSRFSVCLPIGPPPALVA